MDEDEHLELYGREPSMGSIYHLSDKGVRAKPREFPIGFHQPTRREDRMKEVKLWYLASPYSGHTHGREVAFRAAATNAGLLMAAGVGVFSPISHTHPVEKYSPAVRNQKHSFWMEMDRIVFDRCDGVIVLTEPGWLTSTGVSMEIDWAKERGIPIIYMEAGKLPRELNGGN